MNDKVQPKTELSLPTKFESTDEELATPLSCHNTSLCQTNSELETNKEHSSINDFNQINLPNHQHPTQDTIVSSSQYSSAQTTISEKPWDSHEVIPSILNSDNMGHSSQDGINNSTSTDTIIDSDVEIKPPTEEKEKPSENSNLEYDYMYCVAVINRTLPNISEIVAISKINSNVNLDLKSDAYSLNGYSADRSESSSNSTMCSQIEELFLVPKIPRDSFMSSSSSGSSGLFVHQVKPKPNNVLSTKNIFNNKENIVCHKCSCTFPGVLDYLNLDSKDFKSNLPKTPSSAKSNKNKRTKQSHSSKKTLKKTKESTTAHISNQDDNVKTEELKKDSVPTDNIDNPSDEPISFDIGNKVLAYWVADKLFYPATIIDIMLPKFKVKFMSDFVIKPVNIEGLVHSSSLKQGSPIAIFDTVSQEYRVGDIVSINDVPNGDKTYTIDLDSEEVVVPFEKLVLSLDNARTLQNKVVLKSYDKLSMSNVSEGKRHRLMRSANTKSVNNTKNEVSKRKKTKQDVSESNKKKRKCLFPERNIPSTSTGKTEEEYDFSNQCVNSSDSEFDQVREDLTTINMRHLKNSDIDSEHSSPDKNNPLNKYPVSKSIKVFKDLNFVISYAKYKRLPMANDSDLSTDNDQSFNSEYFKPDKVHKKHLESLINRNGGTVHRYLNLIPRSRYKSSYIITDTPSQTCNFFLGLSLGVPAYHHKYIEQSVLQKTPFLELLNNDNIRPIPNGWSVEKREIIFRSPTTVHSRIFSGYIIYLALTEGPKNDFFAGLLRFGGAIVYTSWKNGVCMPLTRHTVIIITDENCPHILANAKVPKLTILWVVQSLVCESARPINGHESFIAVSDESDKTDAE